MYIRISKSDCAITGGGGGGGGVKGHQDIKLQHKQTTSLNPDKSILIFCSRLHPD